MSNRKIQIGDVYKLHVNCLNNPRGTEGKIYDAGTDGSFGLIKYPNGAKDEFELEDIGFFLEFVRNEKEDE